METKTAFAPVLRIRNGVTDIDFYKKAFGAKEHMRLKNDDGSIHVAELTIDDAMFHLHEIYPPDETFHPEKHSGIVMLGLMIADVQATFNNAITAGATVISPVIDYDYGYRQGTLLDPFGHQWVIQCRIPAAPDWKG